MFATSKNSWCNGDNRTYERICVLRAVTSVDGMTAESFKFPEKFLESCANEIINNVKGIPECVMI